MLSERYPAICGSLTPYACRGDDEAARETLSLLQPLLNLADPELELEIRLLAIQVESKGIYGAGAVKTMAGRSAALARNNRSDGMSSPLHALGIPAR